MCGIVGYCGQRLAVPLLIEGLHRLEYRGYDSAGVALPSVFGLQVVKRADEHGQGINLISQALQHRELTDKTGIAHTRWATHGAKTDINAHPHVDCSNTIAVVHNGIIANQAVLRQRLQMSGHVFRSSTDTEVIVHLIESYRRAGDDLLLATQKTIRLLEGEFALVILDNHEPDSLVGTCRGAPLFIGIAGDGLFMASDHEAFRASTEHFVALEDDEVAIINADGTYRILSDTNSEVRRSVEQTKYELEALERGDYPTFMLKEIFEQPEALRRATEGRLLVSGQVRLGGIERRPDFERFLKDELTNVILLGCGTSLYAGQFLARYFQDLGLQAEAMDAAEFAYAPVQLTSGSLVIPISQSGETRDLIEAMDRVKAVGCWSFALCNKPGTNLTKYGPGMYLHAGPEKGVASTKAFTSQVISGALLGLTIAQARGRVNTLQVTSFSQQVDQLSKQIQEILDRADAIQQIGASLRDTPRMLYIGRGYNLPIAMEGALKMMEITRIPALGMSAAAMKHGPIALVDHQTVVVAVCLPDPHQPQIYRKTLDNVNQVISNQGRVLAIVSADDTEIAQIDHDGVKAEWIIRVPVVDDRIMSVLAVVPLQLLAHGTAIARGLDPDKPKNLAKAVTVS